MTAPEFTRRDITLANWRQHPFSRWAFQNVEELVPSARIAPPGAPEEPVAEPGLIASLSIHGAGGPAMPVIEHLKATHTDHFVMLRGGVVLDEWAAPHADAERPHLIFSVSKSITGLLAGIAAGDGRLDPDKPVSHYVPVRRGGAYGKATVRHLLDMTVSLAFEENYLDAKGAFARYRRATLWNPQARRASRPCSTCLRR